MGSLAQFPRGSESRVIKELSKVSEGKILYNPLQVTEKVKTLFLPAWNEVYPRTIKLYEPEKVVICWTSPPIQSEFMPVELEYLRTILYHMDNGKIHALWLGSEHWLPLLKKNGRKVFYAPYPVSMPAKVREKVANHPPKEVGLFGPLHPRKNVVNQLIAVKMTNCRVHFTDESAIPLVNSIGVDYVSHGWLSEDKYEELLLNMDICMQVSVPGVESFSYVCWDAISRDIPCLTSVDWAPPLIQVSKPLDPDVIAQHLAGNPFPHLYKGWFRTWAEKFAVDRNHRLKEILAEELSVQL